MMDWIELILAFIGALTVLRWLFDQLDRYREDPDL
jgi:hypothetical protein